MWQKLAVHQDAEGLLPQPQVASEPWRVLATYFLRRFLKGREAHMTLRKAPSVEQGRQARKRDKPIT